ncbi:hypothetical protein IMZ48_11430 [Candidatus Bathyarchaeota archaeon]|nr:hypothetical protein [Candidatus Bathyarchaeota archaeon]
MPLGNVWCFLGMALSTFFFWPLPLLHGRKPYILGWLTMALVLLVPQAIAVGAGRRRDVGEWRMAALVSRGVMGVCLAFASINFYSILMDLFGASIASSHREQSAEDGELRRREDEIGIWLGVYTWSWLASVSLGFGIGEVIADHRPPIWGFYLITLLLFITLVLNILMPNVRGVPYKRAVGGTRTLATTPAEPQVGNVTLQKSPGWWGQEVYHGLLLSLEMLRQPGFLVLALYTGWVYAQAVLTMLFLVSLSGCYNLTSRYGGYMTFSMAAGALVSVPFQKGNVFSRSRYEAEDLRGTGGKLAWSSRAVWRVAFTVLLPLAIIGYTIASDGRPMSLGWPVALAACTGFLSCLAVSESNALIMETFDVSDLEPGAIPRGSVEDGVSIVLASSPLRVTAGLACCHALAFLLTAAATAVDDVVQGDLGRRVAMGAAAGVLILLTLLLLLVIFPFKEVRVGRPGVRGGSRRSNVTRLQPPEDGVKPDNTVRMSIFHLGSMTRWRFAGGDGTDEDPPAQAPPENLLSISVPQAPSPPSPSARRALGTEVMRKERPEGDGLY